MGYTNDLKKLDGKTVRKLCERFVPFEDLTEVSLWGNVFCPFHDNKHTPSARFYDNEGVVTLYCFNEQRRFNSYDYIVRVLRKDPVTYLARYCSEMELSLYNRLQEFQPELFDSTDLSKSDEINNLWVEADEDVKIFIDSLYKGYDLRSYLNG